MLTSRSVGRHGRDGSPSSRISPSVGSLEARRPSAASSSCRSPTGRAARRTRRCAIVEVEVVDRGRRRRSAWSASSGPRLALAGSRRSPSASPVLSASTVRARSPCARTAAAAARRARSQSARSTSISVPIALMVGETPKRIADQIRTGSGCGSTAGGEERRARSRRRRARSRAARRRRSPATSAGSSDQPHAPGSGCAPRSIAACSTSGVQRCQPAAHDDRHVGDRERDVGEHDRRAARAACPSWVNNSSADDAGDDLGGHQRDQHQDVGAARPSATATRTSPNASSVPSDNEPTSIVTAAISSAGDSDSSATRRRRSRWYHCER